ncbi:CoA transferase [uncultured Paraglaciecola sp.]|uniref:CoA transferase n=1 Tax=uncultured Paraglaciecola sp. TaxID=1765024 RepID=UPI0030DB8B95
MEFASKVLGYLCSPQIAEQFTFSALSHIHILELSRSLAGPWAGEVLAKLAAEAIKVEKNIANLYFTKGFKWQMALSF